jgi:probable F420-dependent oxidoreductase
VKLGVHYRATTRSMPIVEFAAAAQERGFGSLFVPEHTHIPVCATEGGAHPRTLPERYKYVWDPFTALAFVAASTSLRVGTCVCLPGQHDPIALAKTVASLDVLSRGRIAALGVGFGSSPQEFANHGLPLLARRQIVQEKVLAMRSLWRDEIAAFRGEHVTIERCWAWPKPQSEPAVLLGCGPGPRNFEALVQMADGWIPQMSGSSEQLAAHIRELRAAWYAAGRSSDPRLMIVEHPAGQHVIDDLPAQAPTAELRARRGTLRRCLAEYAALGVERVVLAMPEAAPDVLLAMLDELAWTTRLDLVTPEEDEIQHGTSIGQTG